jgi:hypothetical protein
MRLRNLAFVGDAVARREHDLTDAFEFGLQPALQNIDQVEPDRMRMPRRGFAVALRGLGPCDGRPEPPLCNGGGAEIAVVEETSQSVALPHAVRSSGQREFRVFRIHVASHR